MYCVVLQLLGIVYLLTAASVCYMLHVCAAKRNKCVEYNLNLYAESVIPVGGVDVAGQPRVS